MKDKLASIEPGEEGDMAAIAGLSVEELRSGVVKAPEEKPKKTRKRKTAKKT